MATPHRLTIHNFAHIARADVTFGDLTVLVGAQGTGKSLALQWLKAAIDGYEIMTALREAGEGSENTHAIVDLIFGSGMGAAWNGRTGISFDRRTIAPVNLGMKPRHGDAKARVFFIPAHRSMLISDGWALPFQKVPSSTPIVARMFSQTLFELFTARREPMLLRKDSLNTIYAKEIDQAVFHGGRVAVEVNEKYSNRHLALILRRGISLPFMTWTAGQREFTPLLLGLEHLVHTRRHAERAERHRHQEWVIIEEPEMGLHPQAITVVLLLVLDLLWRNYRVVLSTHSPHVLTALWMLRQLQKHGAHWQLVREAFGAPASIHMRRVAEEALNKTYVTHSFAFGPDGKVHSKDISSLDPGSQDDAISGWGGLTESSSRFGDAVRKAVNGSDA